MTTTDGPISGPKGFYGSLSRWLFGALAACAMMIGAPVEASAQTRTLKLFNVHTKERASITYKRGNSYDAAALKKINVFLRDWRKNQPTKMDPRVLDVLWEVYRRTGASGDIHIICGFRSPGTNSMLRSRSKGVAKNSQHTMGKAIDYYIPGVSLKKLRDTGLQLQAGGVGYYPRSGSPFVHMDVGNVRHWPRIGQQELASIMSKGSKMNNSGGTIVASAKRSGGLLSAFFGRGAEEEDGEASEETVVAAAPVKKPVAAAAPKPKGNLPGIEIVPPEQANPIARAAPEPVEEEVAAPETIIAALPTRNVPIPAFAPRPKADLPETVDVAEAIQDPATAVENAPTEEVALGIPLPTWRPEHKPAQGDADATALLAMAATEVASDAAEITAPLPAERPIIAKQGRVAKKADEKVITASIEPVKTTRKDARPSRVDSKPEPRAVVVAAQPATARWALDKNYVSAKSKGTKAPSFAYNVVRTAPLEVYTSGFQQGSDGGDINRFSGKAVKFLTVARFQAK